MNQHQIPPDAGAAPTGSGGMRILKFLACGCLTLFLLGLIGGGACFYGAISLMKSSDAYQMAERLARTSPAIEAEIGEVTGFGFMPSGSVSTSNDTGTAELTLTVHGTRGSGTLHFQATLQQGEWRPQSVVFVSSDGSRTVIESNQFE